LFPTVPPMQPTYHSYLHFPGHSFVALPTTIRLQNLSFRLFAGDSPQLMHFVTDLRCVHYIYTVRVPDTIPLHYHRYNSDFDYTVRIVLDCLLFSGVVHSRCGPHLVITLPFVLPFVHSPVPHSYHLTFYLPQTPPFYHTAVSFPFCSFDYHFLQILLLPTHTFLLHVLHSYYSPVFILGFCS